MNRFAKARLVMSAALALLFLTAPAVAQETLQQQNDQILAELKTIRLLLERMAGPAAGGPPTSALAPSRLDPKPAVLAALTSEYVLGNPDAPVTMVEFTDLQCPYCRQFHISVFPQLKKDYIDTGKVRFVSYDFPLAIHPMASPAAQASRCAGAQGRWWEMREAILVNNPTSVNAFTTYAGDLQIDLKEFKTCFADSSRFAKQLKSDEGYGVKVGVNGTPTFLLGTTSQVNVEGVLVVGAQPYAVFEAKLKELLAGK